MAYLCHLGFDFNMVEALKAIIVAVHIPNKYKLKALIQYSNVFVYFVGWKLHIPIGSE